MSFLHFKSTSPPPKSPKTMDEFFKKMLHGMDTMDNARRAFFSLSPNDFLVLVHDKFPEFRNTLKKTKAHETIIKKYNINFNEIERVLNVIYPVCMAPPIPVCVKIAPSPIHGKGIFATRLIVPGTPITYFGASGITLRHPDGMTSEHLLSINIPETTGRQNLMYDY